MKFYKKQIAGILAILVFPTLLTATANSQTKEEDIITLMELTSTSVVVENITDMLVAQTVSMEKKKNPNLPLKAENIISETVRNILSEHVDELFDSTAPLYSKYYTHQEIKDLIVFFNTPIGKKYSTNSSLMMRENAQVTQNWVNKYAPITKHAIKAELKKHGFK